MVLWHLQPVVWIGIALDKSANWLWVQQTANLVLVWLDFSWIEQALKFTPQKAAQGWQLIVPMPLLDTWETGQQGWVQGRHQGPIPPRSMSLQPFCLFGWRNQRRCRATPTPNYLPNVGLFWSSLNNLCSHEQWAHRKSCANFSKEKSSRAGVGWT